MNDLTVRERLIQTILELPPSELQQVQRYVSQLATNDHEHSPIAGEQAPFAPALCIGQRDWPHAPLHRLSDHGTHIVTAGTLRKQHIFQNADRLDLLESILLSKAKESGWQLEAWAVFSNHYHFVAHALPGCRDLASFVKSVHGETAVAVNRCDQQPGRRVWCNFRDTELTYEKSYFARLNYVHHNAEKHGLVLVANQYRWCSAAWFERTATPAQVRTIYGFATGKVNVQDDFDPLPPA